jgi:peptide-methionine (S)-S-oxide reductase
MPLTQVCESRAFSASNLTYTNRFDRPSKAGDIERVKIHVSCSRMVASCLSPAAVFSIVALILTMNASPIPPSEQTTSRATFGGGCFWCVEAVFETINGVKSVTSGYAGGTVPNPTYEQVCDGSTGHAEVIQVEFDPGIVPYADLLEIFWEAHDPTTLNRQGPDTGTQYRSIILSHDEEQKLAAENSRQAAQARFDKPIVTEIVQLTRFYPAEEHHQDYFRKNPNQPYCVAIISPKLRKMQKLKLK